MEEDVLVGHSLSNRWWLVLHSKIRASGTILVVIEFRQRMDFGHRWMDFANKHKLMTKRFAFFDICNVRGQVVNGEH